jgi:nicotinamidase/pyrazinamidase
MSALIIVDAQNDFVLTTGALSVPGAHDAIPIINLLREQNKWDIIVLTADRHPENHCSFQVNNPGSVLYKEFIRPNGIPQVAWPRHCVGSTPGAEFVDSLKHNVQDWHVYKGQDADKEQYSAFEGKVVLREPRVHVSRENLATLLKERGIRQITVCGFATDYCVYKTALDAREAGFDTDVYINACRGVKKETTAAAIKDMRSKGIYCGAVDSEPIWPYLVIPILVSLASLAVAWWYM